jgi:hypothetical protein
MGGMKREPAPDGMLKKVKNRWLTGPRKTAYSRSRKKKNNQYVLRSGATLLG